MVRQAHHEDVNPSERTARQKNQRHSGESRNPVHHFYGEQGFSNARSLARCWTPVFTGVTGGASEQRATLPHPEPGDYLILSLSKPHPELVEGSPWGLGAYFSKVDTGYPSRL